VGPHAAPRAGPRRPPGHAGGRRAARPRPFQGLQDTRGHQAGDELLREAAQRWARELRATDLLARYGGEEFALLLPATPLAEGVEVVDRLRHATPGEQTCSAGVAAWDGEEKMESLVARADRALYHAKASGRNRTRADDRDARLRLGRRLGPAPSAGEERIA
jgi:predicted signal transduction protein with EAL and GGDEF domain